MNLPELQKHDSNNCTTVAMSRRKKTDKGQHFEELYLNERDKNVLLKRQNNEQADTIKRLYTKIRTCPVFTVAFVCVFVSSF